MCVSANAALLSRAAFASICAAAAAPLLGAPAGATEQLAAVASSAELPRAAQGLSAANARAVRIAAASPFVRAAYGAAHALAQSISAPRLRSSILELLADPTPRYVAAAPAPEARARVRQALLDAHLIEPDVPLEAIYPHVSGAAQPFWSTPGSSAGSHHAYPGGLLVHELFNARMAAAFSAQYDDLYFAAKGSVDRDVVVAAAFYHDIMKSVVFAWTDAGAPAKEYLIGGTGGHHVLSGAEAIARGMSPEFVTVLLSAHAAPSLGDEKKVATWCRAAAIVSGVDPISYGLLRTTPDGFELAARYVPIEAFVNHLSDHDFVVSIPAMHDVLAQLDLIAPAAGVNPSDAVELAWWRNRVLSRTTAISLYQTLAKSGESAFKKLVLSA